MFGDCIGLCSVLSLSLPPPTSPNPPVPTSASGRSSPVLGPTAAQMGVGGSQALLAGRRVSEGRVGEGRAPSCKAGAAVTRGVGAARRQPFMSHRGPFTPGPYSLPSVTEPQPPPQERLPLLKCVPGLRLDKSWVDPSTPPRRQRCAKSC